MTLYIFIIYTSIVFYIAAGFRFKFTSSMCQHGHIIILLPCDSSVLRTGGKGCLVEFGVKMIMEHDGGRQTWQRTSGYSPD